LCYAQKLRAMSLTAEFWLRTIPVLHSAKFRLRPMLHTAVFKKSFICDSVQCHQVWNSSKNFSCRLRTKRHRGELTPRQCCGSGIRCFFTPLVRDEFFPDPGSKGYVFWWDFLRNLCSLIFLLPVIKLAPETKKARKKFVLFFIPIFMYRYIRIREPRSGIRCFFTPRIRIRDKKVRDLDPGSGIKHPGSATLLHAMPHSRDSGLRAMQHSAELWLLTVPCCAELELCALRHCTELILVAESNRITLRIQIYMQNRYSPWIRGPSGTVWQKIRGRKSRDCLSVINMNHRHIANLLIVLVKATGTVQILKGFWCKNLVSVPVITGIIPNPTYGEWCKLKPTFAASFNTVIQELFIYE
jgi:hypothetical protein